MAEVEPVVWIKTEYEHQLLHKVLFKNQLAKTVLADRLSIL